MQKQKSKKILEKKENNVQIILEVLETDDVSLHQEVTRILADVLLQYMEKSH